MSKYYFSDRMFEQSHEKKPRGQGWWGFIYMTHEHGKSVENIVWVEGLYTLTEAKKRVIPMLEERGVSKNKTIYVAP